MKVETIKKKSNIIEKKIDKIQETLNWMIVRMRNAQCLREPSGEEIIKKAAAIGTKMPKLEDRSI